MHPEGGVALLPNVPITIKTKKSKESDFIPRHLGEHLRLCRLKRKLDQGEVARQMGTKVLNISRWENDRTEPEIEAVPAILRFLGYSPFPTPQTLPEKMLAKRRVMGWTFKGAAKQFGVHRKTWKAWERGEGLPREESQESLERFLVVPKTVRLA